MAMSVKNNLGKRLVLVVALTAMLSCTLVFTAQADAAYRQVENFAGVPGQLKSGKGNGNEVYERWPENVQLGGTGALAVNYTGAGGIPKGTLYAATTGANFRIARYRPDRSFSEAWQVLPVSQEENNVNAGRPPYDRCGPDGVTGSCLANPTSGRINNGVAVDQTTGNVYVYNWEVSTGEAAISVYSPDGSSLLTRFGIAAPGSETIQSSPEKVHNSVGTHPIAVNADGEVYVFDYVNGGIFYHRVMVFKPKAPGVYTEYEYAGVNKDVGAGAIGENIYPTSPTVDAAGYLYVNSDEKIEKLDPSTPSAAPLCTFNFKIGGITSMTVNPLTGEVFFSSSQDKKKQVRRLNPCSSGTFTEADTAAYSPPRQQLSALVFDPVSIFASGGKPGILYAAAPTAEGGVSKGTYPDTEGESSMGYVFAPAEEVPPDVASEKPSSVTESSARLEGTVNPRGNTTRYIFQYLTDPAYQANEAGNRFAGASESPLGGAIIEGVGPMPVATTVGGLTPGTRYHFRIVAVSFCRPLQPSEECVGAGAGRTFRTFPTEVPGLPDGRAYEMVSPAEKQGGQVFPAEPSRSSCGFGCKPGDGTSESFPLLSSPDGESVVYEGEPFGTGGAVIENEYLGRRTAAGWATTTLAPTSFQNRSGNGYYGFNTDLTEGILGQGAPALTDSTIGEYRNLYTQPTGNTSALAPLLSLANSKSPSCQEGHGQGELEVTYAGGSADLSRIFFQANDALTNDATGECGKANLYEWSGGVLRAVNILPAATTSTPGAAFGSGSVLTNAISDDGSKAFFTGADGNLYVRVDGTRTLVVPGPGNCNAATLPAARVCFLAASTDGSHALLSNGQAYALNGDETAYETGVDLTAGNGGFVGLSGQSDDLSHLYFVDTAILTGAEENSAGAKAESGKKNLYAWVEGTTRFVAVLAAADGNESSGDWAPSAVIRSAEASPNGQWVAFVSTAPLTGFDNVGPTCGINSGEKVPGPCAEVFIYNGDTGSLDCASCNPTESPPVGGSSLPGVRTLTKPYLHQSRYLTDAGRLYFDGTDRLVIGDSNGKVEDVYQYEPAGVGDCTRPDHCVSLISSGRGRSDSNFLTMDEGGENVFFTTRDQLVRADKDELFDLYDARVGGGFPGDTEIPARECEGESCQPPIEGPREVTPSSSAFNGPGNLHETGKPAARCKGKEGKVKTRGKVRCAKPKKQKHTKQKQTRNGQPRRAH